MPNLKRVSMNDNELDFKSIFLLVDFFLVNTKSLEYLDIS